MCRLLAESGHPRLLMHIDVLGWVVASGHRLGAGRLIAGAALVQRLVRIQADYLAHSDAVDLQTWCQRPGWQRSREGLARLADALL